MNSLEKIQNKSDIGNFYEFLYNYKKDRSTKLTEEKYRLTDFFRWRESAQKKLMELLNFYPESSPMNTRVLKVIEKEEYIQEEIEFNTAKNIRVKGSVLIPKKNYKSFPAVISIHDHSGFYYFGREKIIEQGNKPDILMKFKKQYYGGRSWATELVKRGYLILGIDGFYFGSRKLNVKLVSPEMLARCPYKLSGINLGTDEYIKIYNEIAHYFEALLVKHIFISGTNWMGILAHDDRKCVDYLMTRKDVDKQRIGCCGLSLGGFRGAHLAALDSRIKCSVIAGWMTDYESLLFDKLKNHTFMIYIPGLTEYLDLPEIMSMTAPNALFIQQCARDELFNIRGMEQACRRIGIVYDVLKQKEKYKYRFYDNSHEFNVTMQENAFDWFDRWLK